MPSLLCIVSDCDFKPTFKSANYINLQSKPISISITKT